MNEIVLTIWIVLLNFALCFNTWFFYRIGKQKGSNDERLYFLSKSSEFLDKLIPLLVLMQSDKLSNALLETYYETHFGELDRNYKKKELIQRIKSGQMKKIPIE